jgi:IclR family mhp operon transcriptional activator
MSDVEDDQGDAERSGDTVRPIRALLRGLDALQELNLRNGATVTDIAKAIKLPRTTAYRVLETLCIAGLVVRDVADDRYRLTLKVRSLADGFEDEPWIAEVAKPLLAKLGKENAWPLAIASLHGTSALIRSATDRETSAAEGRGMTGRASLLESSAGRILLAMTGDEQRATLLDVLTRSDRPEDKLARDKDQLNRVLAEARNNGWALHDDTVATDLCLAVPVFVRTRVLAAVVMRFTRAAVSTDQVIEKYVPFLKRVAEEIGKAFEGAAPSASQPAA